MELRNIFNATPQSTWQIFSDVGVGFYIPPYQREYNWDKSHINRLFEDVGHGLQLLVESQDSITFLGTLILIDGATLPNVTKSELPPKVRLVIDGQQRLTTILLMNICLHDEIRRRGAKFDIEDEPASKWLYRQTIQVTANLQKTFEEDMNWGESEYQWYPRIIRAYNDSWSRFKDDAKYESPIAAFVHGYSNHIRGADKAKRYTGKNGQSNEGNHVLANYDVIRQKLRIVSTGGDQDLEVPLLNTIIGNKVFQEAILQAEIPDYVYPILSNGDSEDFKQLIRLVLLANFLMNRVTVTVVSTYNEDYAFDMFESLNTTGEPLTAFETFRPKVIEAEGLSEYKDSASRQYMKPIEKYLEKFNKAEDRHTETSRLLTPFALAETGERLSRRHSDQRRYLRKQYDELGNINEKREFVQHLSHTAIFFEKVWQKEGSAFGPIAFSNKDLVLMCMDVLGRADHHITIGPLVRFYSQVLLAPPGSHAEVNELEEAIKAMTAFFALWRGSGRTTGSLTAQYRELMEKGFDEAGIRPFCRWKNVGETSEILTAEELREALRYALERGSTTAITSKEDWVRRSAERPIYQVNQPLTRFLLFTSIHDTTEDDECLGLPCAGRKDILNMLTWEKWDQDLTIEHVAPQKADTSGWSELLYENPNLVDYLGNLTLLPKAENSSFSSRPWSEKKEMYCILSSSTQDELDDRLIEAEDRGIQLSDSTKELLRNGKYFQHLSTICNAEEWSDEFVQKRSRRLAELVWTNIAPWLGFDDEE